MFRSIYNVYVSSINFLRKNKFIILPYFLVSVLYWFFGRLFPRETMLESAVYVLGLGLVLCFTETYSVGVVYSWENITHSSNSPWRIVREFYNQAVLLFVYFFLTEIFLKVIVRIFALQSKGFLDWFVSLFLFFGFFLLGLRHKIFYNTYTGSGIAGLRHLFGNFFFYLVIGGTGIAIVILPALTFPLFQAKYIVSAREIGLD